MKRIQEFLPGAHVYVADSSRMPRRYQGAVSVPVGVDAGIGAKRNALVAATSEPYIWLLDDDMLFTDDTHLATMWHILHSSHKIGLVSCRKRDRARNRWANSEGNFIVQPKVLRIERPHISDFTRTGVPFLWCDMAPMFFLARRRVLECVPFDESTKTCGEHIDWFLRLAAADGNLFVKKRMLHQAASNPAHPIAPINEMPRQLGLAFYPHSSFVDTGERPAGYRADRRRGKAGRRAMKLRWGFQKIVNWNGRVKAKADYGI